MDTLTVAAVNWKIRPANGVDDFLAHAEELAVEAKNEGADLVVFPENFAIELLSNENYDEKDVPKLSQELHPALQSMAKRVGVGIVGGSHLERSDDGQFRNVCHVFDSQGVHMGSQEKVKLTTYEREVWNLSPGRGLALLSDSKVGVLICYDSEFPEAGRSLAERGVLLLCVPAFTETMHGFHRVRHSCHARAIENQVFVVHSSLVGSLGKEPVPNAVGSSAIIAPSIEPFPANGVLAETAMNEEAIVVAKLDFEALLRAREVGDVRNWHNRDAECW